MINIIDRSKIAKMGFETVKNSADATNLFHAHFQEIEKTFTKLHAVKADYTLLVFWDVDCGHCQKEIPIILEEYHALQKQNKDIKVFAVYTEKEYDKYIKYLDEKKLDWINVYDGTYFNNINSKYDIVSTPVVYLLDKNKTIKAKHFSATNIKDIVNALEIEAAKEKNSITPTN
jgi:thiol-disulfide isomerase/thioredoxin